MINVRDEELNSIKQFILYLFSVLYKVYYNNKIFTLRYKPLNAPIIFNRQLSLNNNPKLYNDIIIPFQL